MNPLVLPQAEYETVFQRLTQLSLEYLASIPDRPSFPEVTGCDLESWFSPHLPQQGLGTAAFDDLAKVIAGCRPNSPRFFGYVFGSGEPVAAAAGLLTAVLNQNTTAWRSAPSAVTLERIVVGWLAEAVGCGGFTGSLTGGGSPANLMALAMAREARLPANQQGARPGTVYASEQAHMSIAKAVALLGIGRDYLRLIACDDQFRTRPEVLRAAIARDIAAGLVPIAIVGSAGTVATGSIDPLDELAAIAGECGAWFHVDGAYGALASIAVPERFVGLNQADSLSLDPHKWLYQPVDCGCLLYRDAAAARRALSHTGEYVRSLLEDTVEGFAFFEESMELSRPFRALKLWLSLRYHGLEKFRDSIHNDLQNAQRLAELISRRPELELLAPIPLSAVCFRHVSRQDSDALNRKILQRVVRRGRVFLSNASIEGRFALRACFVNHRTTADDVGQIVDEVLLAGREVAAGAEP
ncbi:MAG TPA: pyridoxal-dependent decarboxylase [Candidatus Binatia bacterium]|nr:pyridoxal-dependent decarboxylase [Candidatus Binatia bacterium]